MLLSMLQHVAVTAPRATLNYLTLSAAAALVFALSLIQLTLAVVSLAERGHVPGGFWTFLASLLLLVALSGVMTRSGHTLADTLRQDGGPEAHWAGAWVQILSTMTFVAVFILLLFVQSFVLFAITVALTVAFWQILSHSTGAARRDAQTELALQHRVAERTVALTRAGASAQAWREEALHWVRADMRHDLVDAGRNAMAAERTAWQMTLWSRLRWYALLVFALFILPAYTSTPPASLTLVAFVMLFLDRVGVLLLNISRESELWAQSDQK